jgi:hypothetical protein
MRYETVKALKDENFKRSTGVSRKMFEKMLAVLQKEIRDFGRPSKLDRADQLMPVLMINSQVICNPEIDAESRYY